MTKKVYATFATDDFKDLNDGVMRHVRKERYRHVSDANRDAGLTDITYYGVCRRLKNGRGWLVLWVNTLPRQSDIEWFTKPPPPPTKQYFPDVPYTSYLRYVATDSWNHAIGSYTLSLKHTPDSLYKYRTRKGIRRSMAAIYSQPIHAS